jgi:hypothetical protein
MVSGGLSVRRCNSKDQPLEQCVAGTTYWYMHRSILHPCCDMDTKHIVVLQQGLPLIVLTPWCLCCPAVPLQCVLLATVEPTAQCAATTATAQVARRQVAHACLVQPVQVRQRLV